MAIKNSINARHAVTQYCEALVAGDLQRLAELLSSADYCIKVGTDVGEIVKGGRNVLDYYFDHVRSTDDFSIRLEDLDVQERGNAAWFFSQQLWSLKWLGVREELMVRMTGVLEKEGEVWKIVQIHASLGWPAD